MAVSAKSENPQVGQATTNNFKNISRAYTLILTDMHGRGLRLRVLQFNSNNLSY